MSVAKFITPNAVPLEINWQNFCCALTTTGIYLKTELG